MYQQSSLISKLNSQGNKFKTQFFHEFLMASVKIISLEIHEQIASKPLCRNNRMGYDSLGNQLEIPGLCPLFFFVEPDQRLT